MNCCAAALTAAVRPSVGVQIVDDHHVDAAVEGRSLVLHVGLDRAAGEERTVGALDRNVHQREGGDRLRFPSSSTWKSSFFRSRTRLPLPDR